MPHSKRTIKLQLMLDPEELEIIDDWRFANRLPSRAAAIRELMRRGLSNTDADDAIKAGARSRDYGVTDE
jgi:hypothetical protein